MCLKDSHGTSFTQVLKASKDEPITQALLDHPDPTLDSIDRLFEHACCITGMTGEGLLSTIDFSMKDFDPDRLDAVFGVLRAIEFLANLGFIDIRPLRATNSPRSDIIACFDGKKFSIEVVTSSRRSYRWPGHVKHSSNLVRYIVDKCQEKQAQLRNTLQEINAEYQLLVLVLNSSPARALMNLDDYQLVLQEAYAELGSPKLLYLGITTGLPSQNAIYPRLDS